jgi:biotin transport system substrate-specific component
VVRRGHAWHHPRPTGCPGLSCDLTERTTTGLDRGLAHAPFQGVAAVTALRRTAAMFAPMASDPSTAAATGSSTDALPPTSAPRRGFVARDLALVAAFAALIAGLSYLGAIPVGGAGVPITLQSLGVLLAGCALGPVRGGAAVLLYLLLGVVGLPVYAEHSAGLGVWTGPSAGYLVGFPIGAVLAGFLVAYVARSARTRAVAVFACALVANALVIHLFGIVGLMVRLDLSFAEAFKADLPFWIGDLLKTAVVGIVVAELHRAFPTLLQRR